MKWRSSKFGGCTRMLVHLARGNAAMPPPEKLQAVFDRGKQHEVDCLNAMESAGWLVFHAYAGFQVDQGQVYGEIALGGGTVTTHLDGILTEWEFDSRHRNLEIKSPASWAKFQDASKAADWSDPLMRRYAWQVSIGQALTGLETVVACLDGDYLRWFVLETPPFSREEIAERVALLERLVVEGTPDACDVPPDWGCGARYLHDRAEAVDDPILDGMMRLYAAKKESRDMAEERMKQIRAAIDTHLGLSDSLTTVAGTATRVPDSVVTDYKASYLALCDSEGLNPDVNLVKKRRAGYINVTPRETPDES